MGAGPSTGKPFLNTNDLRSDLAKLISNKSSNFFWWTLIMILIFAIIVALSWYVFIEVEGGKFWNAEHKDIYYNRAIIGSTIGLHIVLGIILIYVSIEYYNLLKREDNFITDIAVLGDVSKLSANARPSLAAMIQGRLGESAKNLELPAVGELGQYLNRGSILGGASAAGLLASNTLQQPQTVSQSGLSNPESGSISTNNKLSKIPNFDLITRGINPYNDNNLKILIDKIIQECDKIGSYAGGQVKSLLRIMCSTNKEYFADSVIAGKLAKAVYPIQTIFDETSLKTSEEIDELLNSIRIEMISGGYFTITNEEQVLSNGLSSFINYIEERQLWGEIESVQFSSSNMKSYVLFFKS